MDPHTLRRLPDASPGLSAPALNLRLPSFHCKCPPDCEKFEWRGLPVNGLSAAGVCRSVLLFLPLIKVKIFAALTIRINFIRRKSFILR
jgi:hypothetical protein